MLGLAIVWKHWQILKKPVSYTHLDVYKRQHTHTHTLYMYTYTYIYFLCNYWWFLKYLCIIYYTNNKITSSNVLFLFSITIFAPPNCIVLVLCFCFCYLFIVFVFFTIILMCFGRMFMFRCKHNDTKLAKYTCRSNLLLINVIYNIFDARTCMTSWNTNLL